MNMFVCRETPTSPLMEVASMLVFANGQSAAQQPPPDVTADLVVANPVIELPLSKLLKVVGLRIKGFNRLGTGAAPACGQA